MQQQLVATTPQLQTKPSTMVTAVRMAPQPQTSTPSQKLRTTPSMTQRQTAVRTAAAAVTAAQAASCLRVLWQQWSSTSGCQMQQRSTSQQHPSPTAPPWPCTVGTQTLGQHSILATTAAAAAAALTTSRGCQLHKAQQCQGPPLPLVLLVLLVLLPYILLMLP